MSKLSFSELMKNLDNSPEGTGLTSGDTIQLLPVEGNQHARHFGTSSSIQPNTVDFGSQAAVQVIRDSLDKELGTGGADKVFRDAGLDGAQSLSGRDLGKVSASYNKVRREMVQSLTDVNRPSLNRWQDATSQKTPSKEVASNLTLEQLLSHPQAKWSISESGATGALIVSLPGGRGAVVKIESKESAERVEKLAGVMQDSISGPEGFNIPGATSHGNLTPQNEVVTGLISKLETLEQQKKSDPILVGRIQEHLRNLKDGANLGNVGVSKMEFVPGIQVNKLPLDDKMALLQSGALAEQVGKASVLTPLMGLKDHMSLGNRDGIANLSNFMIDPSNGKLAPIDLDAQDLNHGTGKPVFYGHEDAGRNVVTVAGQLKEKLSSREGTNQLIDSMIDMQDPRSVSESPLAPGLQLLTAPERAEGLFDTRGENAYERHLMNEAMQSPEMRERQALSMLKGLVGGMKYVQENGESMKQAFEKHGQGMSGDDFDKVTQSVNGLDFAKMEQQIDQRERLLQQKKVEYDKLLQSKKEELRKDLVEQNKGMTDGIDANLDKYQKRLNKLENPGLYDRLRALRYGGVKGSKAAFTEKQESTLARKQDFDRQIDKALNEQLNNLKTDLWKTAHQKVESEQQNLKQSLDKSQKQDVGVEKLAPKPELDQGRNGLELNDKEARQLLKSLEKVRDSREELALSEKEANELMVSLDKLSKEPKQDLRKSLKISDEEFAELQKALDEFSPERLQDARKLNKGVGPSDRELQKLIDDLKSMDIDKNGIGQQQSHSQKKPVELSNEDIDKMIDDLRSLNQDGPSQKSGVQQQVETHDEHHSVRESLGLKKVGSESGGPKQSQKPGHHSLREEHPELVHEQGQKQKGPDVHRHLK